MIQLDYKSGVPIYDQLVNGIIRLKALGALKANEPLPSVRAMAAKLSINPNTVQRAYALLEQKGIIYSVTGKGSFISDDKESENAIRVLALEELKIALKQASGKGLTKEDILALAEELFKGGTTND